MAAMCRLPALCLLLAACHHSSPAPDVPLPPPGTGLQIIDMEGGWEVASLVRTDDPAHPVPVNGNDFLPFLPLVVGQHVVVHQGQLVDSQGQPLYSVWSPTNPNDRYLNLADGRVMLFDFHNTGNSGCFWDQSIRAAFGSTPAGELDGVVTVFDMSTCPGPQWLHDNGSGTFAVHLRRPTVLPSTDR
jgi:hypothetical protein